MSFQFKEFYSRIFQKYCLIVCFKILNVKQKKTSDNYLSQDSVHHKKFKTLVEINFNLYETAL